jgi:hypothetical protein
MLPREMAERARDHSSSTTSPRAAHPALAPFIDEVIQLFVAHALAMRVPVQQASDDHAVVLNKVRATRGGKILEQDQVVVMHIEGVKLAEVWLQFSDQQAMDEFASS